MKEVFWQSIWFAEVIQWVTFAILIILIFLPFIIVNLKYFRPTKWYHIFLTYVFSFGIAFSNPYLTDFLVKRLGRLSGFTNIVFAIDHAQISSFFWLFVLWPFSVFYAVRLLYGKFTLKNCLVALGFAILFFGGLVWYALYEISKGFGELLIFF